MEVKSSWLRNGRGEILAPKTLAENVQYDNGKTLETAVHEAEVLIDKIPQFSLSGTTLTITSK